MKKIILLLLIVTLSFAFFRWSADIDVVCEDNITALSYGVDSFATDGYDAYLDVPFFPIPGGGYGYFTINDSMHPAYRMLCVDYRAPSSGELIWDFTLQSGTNFVIEWQPILLPDSGEFFIGAYDMDSLPSMYVTEWEDMREIDSIAIFMLGGQIRALGAPVSEIGEKQLPTQYNINAYPNPFNSTCNIISESTLDLSIFDINGKTADFEITEVHSPGSKFLRYSVKPPETYPSGMYFIRSAKGNFSKTIPICYIK